MDEPLRTLFFRELWSAKAASSSGILDIADIMPSIERAWATGHSDGFRNGQSAQKESDAARQRLCPKCRGCAACRYFYGDAQSS